ncbi:hypothetical protein Acsp02_84630 [Actinoplanes sp. NBRC 103695]|nr:hypothetical protein Acsp02_84630 [Actinoplanes sp. NBRC 103695]
MARDNAGCAMPSRSAARPKCSSVGNRDEVPELPHLHIIISTGQVPQRKALRDLALYKIQINTATSTAMPTFRVDIAHALSAARFLVALGESCCRGGRRRRPESTGM